MGSGISKGRKKKTLELPPAATEDLQNQSSKVGNEGVGSGQAHLTAKLGHEQQAELDLELKMDAGEFVEAVVAKASEFGDNE